MNIVVIAKSYLLINILIAVCSMLVFAISKAGRWANRGFSYAQILRISYVLVGASLALPWLSFPGVTTKVWQPTAQVWSAYRAKHVIPSAAGKEPPLAISVGDIKTPIASETVTLTLAGLLILGWSMVGWRVIRDSRILATILKGSFPLKTIGKVSIRTFEDVLIPFSVWLPFRAFVVVPQSMVMDSDKLRLIVKHELQHHRQQDTKWLYAMQFIGALCFWNPFAYFLQKQLGDLQEIACDEALIGHQGISSKAYCDCLLWVAQHSLQSRSLLVGTAGFARGSAAKLLKRRVEEMFKMKGKFVPVSGLLAVGTGIFAAGFLTVATAATQSSVQDERIDRSRAEEMARNATSDEFKVVLNDLVLDQLNRYLGTPDGRAFMRKGLKAMKTYETGITATLNHYHLPLELLAVPLIESGYKNEKADGVSGHGAGLWMFVRQTARNYGLRIDDQVDERLDIARETDAAARLLLSLKKDFGDWGLAMLAYNSGDGAVRQAIRDSGSNDVWEIIRQGHENDPHYLASIMAAVMIMKNPSSVE